MLVLQRWNSLVPGSISKTPCKSTETACVQPVCSEQIVNDDRKMAREPRVLPQPLRLRRGTIRGISSECTPPLFQKCKQQGGVHSLDFHPKPKKYQFFRPPAAAWDPQNDHFHHYCRVSSLEPRCNFYVLRCLNKRYNNACNRRLHFPALFVFGF